MKASEKHATLSEINVTPLVDVMLVLLVVFMITAPMMSQRIDISIPETKEVESLPAKKEPLIINIKQSGAITLGESDIVIDNIGQKIKAITEGRDGSQIFIRADRRVEYGVVAEVIAELKSSGLSMISLVTLPKN